MTDPVKLSRRERQIMDVLYARREASVLQLRADLPDAPTPMAIRRMLSILEQKGYVKRRKDGREFAYAPKLSHRRAGLNALQHVIDTFFEGSLGTALATHLEKPGKGLSNEDVQRLSTLIDSLAEKEGAEDATDAARNSKRNSGSKGGQR